MNNFCAHPWVSLDIDPQGYLRPCCKYTEDFGTDLTTYHTSNKLSILKSEFLENKRPAGCIRCWNDEDAGLPSKRLLDKIYRYDESKLDQLQVLSLAFGNTCNLACRTCGSNASSKWAAEEKKLQNHFKIQIHSHTKFYQDTKFTQFLKDVSSTLVDINFPGGESFLTGVEYQHQFLDFLLANHPERISLTYMTNCTVFPDSVFWDKWKQFKHVEITLSIDGIKEKFEYLRWPAKWDVCYNHIKSYQDSIARRNNMKLSISHTVSIFNVLELNNFFIWCMKEKLPEPYLGMVENPSHYNVKTLPEHVKKLVKNRLSPAKFSAVTNFMLQPASSKLDDFLEWTQAVDTLRNQQFSTIFPELSKILNQ